MMNTNMQGTGPQHSDLHSSTIMMVDDEPVMLDIVQVFLEEAGYRHFINIEDSTKAVGRLINANPDILLLDLDMPEVGGFQILKQVRALDDFKHLPVIILTASDEPFDKLKALELGATDFLSKPVDPSELALRVKNTLAAKRYQDNLVYYDSLTGLANRKLFLGELSKQILRVTREGKSLVLLDIGLDQFRQLNETLGVNCGDEVLKTVAQRLLSALPGNNLVGRDGNNMQVVNIARTGGNEFSVVLHGVRSAEDMSMICNLALDTIRQPMDIYGNDIQLTASIGIAVAPGDGDDADTLFKHATSTKDFSQKQGKDRYQFFSAEMEAHSRALLKMMSDLRMAQETYQFELFYQPQIDATSGRIVGLESLVRWNHPKDGVISPMKFIPLAEETGLIVPLGEWILNEACRNASDWINAGYDDLKVSVNVSANQFKDPGFKASVVGALQSSGLDPQNLVLEITESMLMDGIDQQAILFQEIKQLGVSFSLDDFGTGYSSLSYLKKFPIDELKIDRSFILEVPVNNEDNAIIKAIIAMAHALGQKVVAEGVEEEDQLEFLRRHHCDTIQGYYFSKPLNKEDFNDYLFSHEQLHLRHQSIRQATGR